MTTQHLTTKQTTRLVLPVGRWTTVVDHDFPDAINTPYVDCMVYVNVGGALASGWNTGEWTIRAVRRDLYLAEGTVDETAVESYPLFRRSSTSAAGYVTHLWMGANPGGFLWQVLPRSGVLSMYCTTRYAKVHTKG